MTGATIRLWMRSKPPEVTLMSRPSSAWRRVAAALLLALAVLLFCSKSSPLYPINDWADANIYLTIGKGMTRGQVVYRDLYDHKGPLLYALHALCALVSFTDFTGVFVMEWLFAAAFLYFVHAFLKSMGAGRWAWALTAFAALAVYASPSFAQGDSAEELALPLIMATLLCLWRFWQSGAKRLSAGTLLANGALAGCVFWIKFTMIGLHAGLLASLLLWHLSRREGREALRALLWLMLGFALSTLPWVLYFGLNGALGDWLKTYLYDNLFLYSAGETAGLLSRVKAMLKCALSWLWQNPLYTLPLLLGLIPCRRFGAWPYASLWLMAGLGALATFVGGKSYVYYGLALAPACVPGLAAIGRRLAVRASPARGAIAALCAACVALCPLVSPNPRPSEGVALGESREYTMQYRVAAALPPDATLLNYGFMDAGFYTAAGLVPSVKYFHQTNVPLQEMKDEQLRYMREGLCDYVIARGNEPDWLLNTYDAILSVESPGFWYGDITLYRKKSAKP